MLIAVCGVGSARAGCREALLLALDVSGSVDAREYQLQLDGLAAALQNPQVREAFFAMPDAPVRLAVMEWSGPGFQRLILPWREIRTQADIASAAAQVRATQRAVTDPSTAIGSALRRGATEVGAQTDCLRWVIDLSGDGKSNTGPRPGETIAGLAGVTVNGLVIGEAVPTAGEGRSPMLAEMVAYYRAYVMRGPGAFVETAHGFRDFESAMVRKLLRELQVVAVAGAFSPRR